MKKLMYLLIGILSFSISFGQYPGRVTWQNIIGGNNNDQNGYVGVVPYKSGEDYLLSTDDGNFIYAVETKSTNGIGSEQHDNSGTTNDIWIGKIDSKSGDILWSHLLGGSKEEKHYNLTIFQNKVILTMYTWSDDGDISNYHGTQYSDIWLCAINELNGKILWKSRALGGSQEEQIKSVLVTTTGDIVVATETGSYDGDIYGHHDTVYGEIRDVWVFKLDGNTGNLLWSANAIGGSETEELASAILTPDNNIFLAIHTSSNDGDMLNNHTPGNSFDVWGVKLNVTSGDIIWKTEGMGGTKYDLIKGVSYDETAIYITCETYSEDEDVMNQHGLSGTTRDIWAIKLNISDGTVNWFSDALGGSNEEYIKKTLLTNDGYLVVFSETRSSDGDITSQANLANTTSDIFVAKINTATGKSEWISPAYGGTNNELLYLVYENESDFFVFCTSASADGDISFNKGKTDIWVLRLDGNSGELLWERSIGGSQVEELSEVSLSCKSEFYIFADTYTMTIDGDITQESYPGCSESLWIINLDTAGNILWDQVLSDGNHAEILFSEVNHTGILITTLTDQIEALGEKTVAGMGGSDVWLIKLDMGLEAMFETIDTICPGEELVISDLSSGAPERIEWDMGDGTYLLTDTVKHTYITDGTYIVTQKIVKGCEADTATRIIYVDKCTEDSMELIIPNAVYLNSLNITNRSLVLRYKDIYNISLSIYNRKGEHIFYSEKLLSGVPILIPDLLADVYIYSINYTTPDNMTHNIKGNFTVIN